MADSVYHSLQHEKATLDDLDPTLPAWKRDLILRKRTGRFGPAGGNSFSRSSSSEDTRRGGFASVVTTIMQLQLDNSALVAQTEDNNSSTRVIRKDITSNKKKVVANSTSNGVDVSDEWKYGPGIVSRLKNKYLNIALREASATTTVKAHPIRRVASLEDWLDKDAVPPPSPVSETTEKTPLYQKNAAATRGRNAVKRQDSGNKRDKMKRARSVDALQRSRSSDSLQPTEVRPQSGNKQKRPRSLLLNGYSGSSSKSSSPVLVNEDIVIIESRKEDKPPTPTFTPPPKRPTSPVTRQTSRSGLPVKHAEMPPPDMVKETVKIFEITTPIPTATVVNNQSKPPIKSVKPIITAKPMINSTSRIPGSPTKPLSPRIISPKLTSSTLAGSKRNIPIRNGTTKPITTLPSSKKLTNGDATMMNGVTSKWNDARTFEVSEEGMKAVPKSAIENIRKDSTSIQFNFSAANSTNRTEINDFSKHPTEKQVGVIKPTISKPIQLLSNTEKEQNFINNVKNLGIVDNITVSNSAIQKEPFQKQSPTESMGLRERKWHQQPENTMVFNFTKSAQKDVPDYIEDDGLRMRRINKLKVTKEPGFVLLGTSSTESSDYDEVDDDSALWAAQPVSPCNIQFVGDNVLINGKSSLQKKPKSRKISIKFNDAATSIFEYPSETSLLVEDIYPILSPGNGNEESEEVPNQNMSNGIPDGLKSNTAITGSIGGLGSYTPSKISIEPHYQLGVSAAPIPQPSSSEKQKTAQTVEEYLRPAQDDQTVAWSDETTSDLLF